MDVVGTGEMIASDSHYDRALCQCKAAPKYLIPGSVYINTSININTPRV
jgi:hypothetical protein